jgi:IS5 family transposase
LIREIKRKLPKEYRDIYAQTLELFTRVHNQKKNDKNKLYSLHELEVSCICKGKAHKKYEFGSKVSFAITKETNIIVGVKNFNDNPYDGHTLPAVLEQVEQTIGMRPETVFCDRGYRGKKNIDGTRIYIPGRPKKKATASEKEKMRHNFRRRAAIEPIIGHVKHDCRMARNYLKGVAGDVFNALMAGAAFNFRKWARNLKQFVFCLYFFLFKVHFTKQFAMVL